MYMYLVNVNFYLNTLVYYLLFCYLYGAKLVFVYIKLK